MGHIVRQTPFSFNQFVSIFMRNHVLTWGLLLTCATGAWGQESAGVKLVNPHVERWQFGITITAADAPALAIVAAAPVPSDWPEQKVRVVEEEVSESVRRVRFRNVGEGARQMVVEIPRLAAGETARAVLTFEIEKREIEEPEQTSLLLQPARPARDVRPYLAPSPQIESEHREITAVAGQLASGGQSGWELAEAIYDWVRENVEYREGDLKGALAALRDGDGDCEELTSLFIALCRANKIPARTVWIPGHCYPEFYLEDEEGTGHWFPCQAAGTRDFGGMPDFRPILQKGDNYKVPEKKEPQRYVAEFLKVQAIRGGGKPQVQFVRQILEAE